MGGLVAFSLESLNEVDAGRIVVAFQHELKRMIDDCRDRPGDKNARTVGLKCAITPILDIIDKKVICNGVNIEFEITGKVPVRRSRPIPMKVNDKGAYFNTDAPDNPDQTTFFDDEGRPAVAGRTA